MPIMIEICGNESNRLRVPARDLTCVTPRKCTANERLMATSNNDSAVANTNRIGPARVRGTMAARKLGTSLCAALHARHRSLPLERGGVRGVKKCPTPLRPLIMTHHHGLTVRMGHQLDWGAPRRLEDSQFWGPLGAPR
jgi:hypothetical protein